MAQFYSKELRRLFTNRKKELEYLRFITEEFKAKKARHTALFGLRRIGKTLLFKKFMSSILSSDVAPVYINFEDICTSVEIFTQRYIGLICYWIFGQDKEIESYLNISRLLSTGAIKNEVVLKTTRLVIDELNKRRPDEALMLKIAFDFPEKLSADLNKPIVLFLDEFHEIITLSNYPQIKDVTKHFRAVFSNQENVLYIIASSTISGMEKLIKEEKSPLFLQFDMLSLSCFTREDTFTLTDKVLKTKDRRTKGKIFKYSFGHPFYVVSICQRLVELSYKWSLPPDEDLVKYAFVLETLSKEGRIYNYCRYLYDISLQKARGYGILKAILSVLAGEDNLILADISRRIDKTPAATREYLHSLINVDLIDYKNSRYYYKDPVLRYWVSYITSGVEVDLFPRKEEIKGLIGVLDERFQRASTELGIAKEGEIRELMRRFNGQKIPGRLFNVEKDMVLPKFRKVEPYRSANGLLEIDVLASDKEIWAVEVKWRNRTANIKEIDGFYKKAKEKAGILWFISRRGFAKESIKSAEDKGMLLSDENDIKELGNLLKVTTEEEKR